MRSIDDCSAPYMRLQAYSVCLGGHIKRHRRWANAKTMPQQAFLLCCIEHRPPRLDTPVFYPRTCMNLIGRSFNGSTK